MNHFTLEQVCVCVCVMVIRVCGWITGATAVSSQSHSTFFPKMTAAASEMWRKSRRWRETNLTDEK